MRACCAQNKLQDLHKQIEELTTRVSSLQNENAALHSRTSILEKVLDMRNEQIQVMQETKEVREALDGPLRAGDLGLPGSQPRMRGAHVPPERPRLLNLTCALWCTAPLGGSANNARSPTSTGPTARRS